MLKSPRRLGQTLTPRFAKVTGRCPGCGSENVRSMWRTGFVEKTLLRILRTWPYRCEECDVRYYDFTRKSSADPGHVSVKLIAMFLTVNILSALLFMLLVNRPVYDDVFNMSDVHSYAQKGVSVSSIRAQKNAPGPSSFIWMAGAVRLVGGNELRAARLGALVSWLFFGGGMILGGRISEYSQLWYGAAISTLVFPHSVIATGTVLTEGPSLLFATLGALAWTEFVSRSTVNARTLLVGLSGGFFLGLAVTCRQYYAALLCSASVIVLFHLVDWYRSQKSKRLTAVFLSLTASFLPVFLLLMIWRGASSPSMAAGISYADYHADLGLNAGRPVIAGFYTLLYLVPLSFPAMAHLRIRKHWPALIAAVIAAFLAVYFNGFLVQPGPVNSLLSAAAHLPKGKTILLALVAAVAAYNAVAAALALWRKRAEVLSCLPLQFALLTILFFIFEQAAVGGNIPFYDRYILQIFPFLAFLAFFLLPTLKWPRLTALICLSVLSNLLLWSHALQK